MKITQNEINRVNKAIAPLDTDVRRQEYRNGYFPRADTVKDLDRRYRWDLYWACGEQFVQDDLLNSHIDTALKRIVPKLEEK